MNHFISYLNTMNSASSDNMNAIAESQVTSEFYTKIAVKRNIAEDIYRYLTENQEAVILTGHAGDGKTSILIQVLEMYGYFEFGKRKLEIQETFKNIHYIKDMSELSTAMQKELLVKMLDAPKHNNSSIIVSNTGPLISTFNNLFDDFEKSEELEKKILDGINNVVSELIEFELNSQIYKFRIINIANIDNSYLVKEIVDNILDQSLWQPCINCGKTARCPIYNNCLDILANKIIVTEQITRLYYWLSEKGKRHTIRQIMAHITYAITSNLNCVDIDDFGESKDILFKYSFANAFFGYRGLIFNEAAINIKMIREIKNLKIDEKSLEDIDYGLFVQENMSYFSENVLNILLYMRSTHVNSLGEFASSDIRKAFRRYLILFGNYSNQTMDHIDKMIMSESFIDYYKSVTSEQLDFVMKRKLGKITFTALYRVFMGIYPKKDEDTLYLSLRKDFHLIQNTQLLIGKVPRTDLSVVLYPKVKSKEPEIVKSQLYLVFENNKFHITAEFLDFMYKFYDGEVFTSLQPSFTFGLSKLKSDLLKRYRLKSDSMTVMIVQKDKVQKMKIKVDGSNIYVD